MGPRILVVDDSPADRRVTIHHLEELGYRADAAENGERALEALERFPYAAVLMDCAMPGMDGYQATREIRRREDAGMRTPVIALTASEVGEDREKCRTSGVDGYLCRPIVPADLARLLEKWLAPVSGAPLAELRELVGDGFPSLVAQYLASSERILSSMLEAAAKGDTRRMADAAHSFRGSSGSFGARRLPELCRRVEAAAKRGDVDGAKAIASEVEAEFARVRDALRPYCVEMPSAA